MIPKADCLYFYVICRRRYEYDGADLLMLLQGLQQAICNTDRYLSLVLYVVALPFGTFYVHFFSVELSSLNIQLCQMYELR